VCDGGDAGAGVPRPAPGAAVDPVHLEPVDEVVLTTIVDNFYDWPLPGADGVLRAPLGSGRASSTRVAVAS
jgi:7,8-dihydropterin-6-yl-methyl-4-(beta-D-ribofuranosyl)aminobenzene 5'-phosphate synthase